MAPLTGFLAIEGTMNTADYMRTLFDALYWARDRVLAAADGMTEEEYARDYGLTYKSLRGILTHALDAENLYFLRASGVPTPPDRESPEAISEKNLPTVEALKARWLEVEQNARAYLEAVTDADLDADVTFFRRDGLEMRQPRWQLLTSALQHSIQHRSEAAELLTMAGRSPGDLDFVLYLNAKAAASR
jgi:uncharacterized damage-inducible protein DinB